MQRPMKEVSKLREIALIVRGFRQERILVGRFCLLKEGSVLGGFQEKKRMTCRLPNKRMKHEVCSYKYGCQELEIVVGVFYKGI